jgi:putative SOS response-associated peptidase YedK
MCGRFTLTERDVANVARRLGAEVDRERARLYRARWNVAPSDAHWIVRLAGGRRELVPARFGFGGPGGELVINARSETAAELAMFRRAFRESRCLVPADGFYEWQGRRGERRPLWFHDRGGGPLAFAGLVAVCAGELAFVILTTEANDVVRPVHDRMPVVLSAEGAAAWLSRGDSSVLAPAPPESLASREVSPLVNSVAHDGPELLPAPRPDPQLTLL